MTIRYSRSPAGFRRAVVLALAVTISPLPLAAADRAPAAPAQPLRTSIAQHAAREVLVGSPKTAQRSAPKTRAQQSTAQSSGFFKSPAGVACLAVIAAGTGFALYSASHDRIHSVARDAQK